MQGAVAQNWFATLALLAWPVVALWLYHTRPVNQATLWTILGGYLLLPVGAVIKLAEGIPQLDKVSVPALAALAGCFLLTGRRLKFSNGFGLAELLLLIFLISPLVTSLLNNDPVMSGPILMPGVGVYDGISAIVTQFLFILPFLFGRQLFRNSTDIEEILRTLVLAALLYSLPMLFEIRISPQLHYWLYGYQPSQFLQQIRLGGFRPVVFIGHGLSVAFFAMTATLAATALWRTRTRVLRFSPARVTAYLSVILLLCKGMASLMYGAAMAPLIRWTTPRLQLRIGMAFVIFALLYPMLRAADLVPTNYIYEAAKTISEERASSLKFRFDNEQRLLDRASQRVWFGWGRFGRSRLYDEWGSDIGVTDGRWTITLGQFGMFGFMAEFGLLALTVFRAGSVLRLVNRNVIGSFLQLWHSSWL